MDTTIEDCLFDTSLTWKMGRASIIPLTRDTTTSLVNTGVPRSGDNQMRLRRTPLGL
jgi:hypothetical protein